MDLSILPLREFQTSLEQESVGQTLNVCTMTLKIVPNFLSKVPSTQFEMKTSVFQHTP